MGNFITTLARAKGLKIVDATDELNINVQAPDVIKATRKDHGNCAFAVACKRQIPGVVGAYFFQTAGYLEYKDRLVKYRLPTSMTKEIAAFDRFHKMWKEGSKPKGLAMEPGAYTAKPTTPSQDKAARTAYAKKRAAKALDEIKPKPLREMTLQDLKKLPPELRKQTLGSLAISLKKAHPANKVENTRARSAAHEKSYPRKERQGTSSRTLTPPKTRHVTENVRGTGVPPSLAVA